LPKRIVMVGGGYIAAEFSNIAARAGAKVTVLQRAERMLTHFHPELVGWLMETFSEIGIRLAGYWRGVRWRGALRRYKSQVHSSAYDALESFRRLERMTPSDRGRV